MPFGRNSSDFRYLMRKAPSGIAGPLWGLAGGNAVRAGQSTYHDVRTAQGPYNAVQLLLLNYSTAGTRDIAAACAAPATTIATAANQQNTDLGAGAWVTATVGGAAGPWTIPAATTVPTGINGVPGNVVGSIVPGAIITDKIKIRSQAASSLVNNARGLPLVMYRILKGAGVDLQYLSAGIAANNAAWLSDIGTSLGQYWNSYSAGGDFVTGSFASFAGFTGDFPPAVIPLFHFDTRAIQIFAPGDSIMQGQITDSGRNNHPWANLAAYAQSTTGFPVEIINWGWPGQSTAQFCYSARQFLDRLVTIGSPLPDICIIPCGSPNDTQNLQANADNAWYSAMDLTEWCISQNITPLLATCTPQNSLSPHPTVIDGVISVINARVRANGALYVDTYSAIAKPSGGIQDQYANTPDPSTDVHPNNAGQIALSNAALPILANLVSQNQ